MSVVPVTISRTVELEIDGESVRVREGATILDACRAQGRDQPTLCYGDTLTPDQRLPRVRGRGGGLARAGAGCARKAEDGMVVKTDTERVRHSRKMVLEFLGSSVDLTTAPTWTRWMEEYEARPERYGPPAPPAPEGARDHAQAGHHHAGDGQTAATVAQPVKVDNESYVRDYAKCILCYKCVEACGTDCAEHLRDRGGRTRVRRAHLDGVRGPAPRLGMRLLRQLHRGLPDRRADVQERARHARGRHLG